ncbi:hypothetical protein Poras_0994 [Porphyromonas asaccharolytica DSM 20707]|uniref:Uncharacterized protein n=1 Tax=Porphyromonas asaccharolytica (strain ATCC 25260 / DSM 20707 / BCRC 10618 / CCUG 7834 / JCM 6326 / LMG 13178 / VPI 4198 / B440) TaxID=879243 RepID=F4KKL2_PORAD|nr:hypothetical protein Poras_0994 [Porphyromonas asaccharolytica DSM 20707]
MANIPKRAKIISLHALLLYISSELNKGLSKKTCTRFAFFGYISETTCTHFGAFEYISERGE